MRSKLKVVRREGVLTLSPLSGGGAMKVIDFRKIEIIRDQIRIWREHYEKTQDNLEKEYIIDQLERLISDLRQAG